MANKNLTAAKKAKNDEFYTQMPDIEKELCHYKQHFVGKTIFCNCDDPTWSNFWRYFHLNFGHFKLKKLIATHYDPNEPTYMMTYEGSNDADFNIGTTTRLQQNGDFRSPECVELLKEADIVVTNPPFSCYSSDTEVMTNHGWKLIRDVDISKDLIMSLNPDTKEIEMVEAVDFIKSPVNGSLYHYYNRNMDFLVTGNHHMYAYNTYDRSLPFVNAEDVKPEYKVPLNGFQWHGKKEDFFILPSTTQLEQYSRRTIIVPEKRIPMKDWLEFFGFYIADGCYRNHINTYGKRDYTISIKQHVDNEEYVLNLINRIGFKAEISGGSIDSTRNYNIYSKQLWEYLSQFGRSKDKYFPREYLDLDIEYLKALYLGYTNGDGSLTAKKQMQFSSVSKQLIDNIQELILKIFGRITQYTVRNARHSYDGNHCTCFYINVTLTKTHENFSKYGKASMVSYNDNVYCLTLGKNHIMLVRHNGKIGWCGNCAREFYLPQLIEYQKKFIIIGDLNWITYKSIFPLIKDNKIWMGYNNIKQFLQPDGTTAKFGNKLWYTNLDIPKRHEPIDLIEHYTPERYPKYDNYDAINVDKTLNIPCDYEPCWYKCPHAESCTYAKSEGKIDEALCEQNESNNASALTREGREDSTHESLSARRKCNGIMGVPISFLDKYCPEQFEILGCTANPEGNSVEKKPYTEKAISLIKQKRLIGAKCVGGNSNVYIDENDYIHVLYHRIFVVRRNSYPAVASI